MIPDLDRKWTTVESFKFHRHVYTRIQRYVLKNIRHRFRRESTRQRSGTLSGSVRTLHRDTCG